MSYNPDNSDTPSPLEVLKIHKEPKASELLDAMKHALTGAGGVEFYDRMEHNHWTRHCWWPDQYRDGRKHVKEGLAPDTVFPWPGASDTRIPIVDEIIRERADIQVAAYDRAELRIMPRVLGPDEDGTTKAALWANVVKYYDEECQANFRTEVRKWIDWSEEFGHAFLRFSWHTEQQLEKRTLTADDVLKMTVGAALEIARAAKEESIKGPSGASTEPQMEEEGREQGEAQEVQLTPEESAEIERQISQQWEEMVMNKDMQEALLERLQAFDEEMPESEARRVAKDLRKGIEAVYYAPVVVRSVPRWRALRPLLDGGCPPETVRVKSARFFWEAEWLSAVELDERVETLEWSATAVSQVKEHKGKSFNPSDIDGLSGHDWVMTGGVIGMTCAESTVPTEESELSQVLHVYYRATSLSGVPALYHSVVSAHVPDEILFHECCEDAHAEYPVWDRVREVDAPTLIASRGVGELSFTQQQETKIQRDLRTDAASYNISPAILVPLVQAGGLLKIRPGRQIPRRSTGPGGGIEPIKLVGETGSSVEVEKSTLESIDRYWGRGAITLPDIKQIRRQSMVNDFLTEMREVRRLTFQLIQQYAPENIRVSAIGGLPVNLSATRAEIQGQVSLSLVFDVADLDFDLVGKKLDMVTKVIRPLDTEGLMPVSDILRFAVSTLMPNWTPALIRNPQSVSREEAKDEDQALTQILCGIEPEYVPGKNHALRLERLMSRINETRPDGGPTMIQQIIANSAQVRQLLGKRLQFHLFQTEQAKDNPEIGRLGVEPGPGNEAVKNTIGMLMKSAAPEGQG